MKKQAKLVISSIGIMLILLVFIFDNFGDEKLEFKQHAKREFNELTIDLDDVMYYKKIDSMSDDKFYLEIVQQKNEELALFAMYDSKETIYSSYIQIGSEIKSTYAHIMTYDQYEYKFGLYLENATLKYEGDHVVLKQKKTNIPRYGNVTLWYLKMEKNTNFNDELLIPKE